MSGSDLDDAAFTRVDWDRMSRDRRQPGPRTLGLVTALLAVVVLYAYDFLADPEELIGLWSPSRADWLVLLAMVFVARYAIVPAVADRDRTAQRARALVRRPAALVSLVCILAFGIAALLGPDAFQTFSYPRLEHRLQPPVFASVDIGDQHFYTCVGDLVGDRCHGTWQYPFGTNRYGENVLALLVSGLRIALKLGLTTAVLMTVIATAVGTVAGYRGGWVDDVLMGYVDVQQTVPAIIVYIILATMFFGTFEGVSDGGLFAFVLVFGLLDWGGIARVVRGDVLTRRSAGYVRAAKAAGASDLQVIRRHVVPNATGTIVTALTRRIPVLILAQVALAFLSLNRINSESLGRLLRIGLEPENMVWHRKWWITTAAVIVLVMLVVTFNVLGDVLRDIFDPRGVDK